MSRLLTVRNIFDSEPDLMPLTGIWGELIEEVEYGDTWLIWGKEKNGKTTFALHLAKELSNSGRVLYVSAEESPDRLNMKKAIKRAGIGCGDKINFVGYLSFGELVSRLKKRGAPRVVVIDNLTMFTRKITPERLTEIVKTHPHITFIFLAHEDKDGEPLGALARQMRIIASVLLQVSGLTAFLGGRSIDGARSIVFNEEKASLCFNETITNENTKH